MPRASLVTYFKPAHQPAHQRCNRFFGQDFVFLKSTISASVTGQNPTWAIRIPQTISPTAAVCNQIEATVGPQLQGVSVEILSFP